MLKNMRATAPILNHISVKLGVKSSAIPKTIATPNHINCIVYPPSLMILLQYPINIILDYIDLIITLYFIIM